MTKKEVPKTQAQAIQSKRWQSDPKGGPENEQIP